MAVTLSPSPIQHFVDANGVALAGGKLFTYGAGSVTKIATYTDSGGATPQTNPIIMNSRGEPSSGGGGSLGLWLKPGVGYKFVLSPATDTDPPTNAIWTEDNILPLSAANITFNYPTLAAFAADSIPGGTIYVQTTGYFTPGDGGGATYVPASAGAGAGKVQTADGQWWKISMPTITPQMLGALGNSTNDVANVAAFQAWASLLNNAAGFVPPGTYNLASATVGGTGIALPTGAFICGMKNASKIVVTGAAACRAFLATNVSNITLKDLWMVGNNMSSSSGDGYAFAQAQTAGATGIGAGFRIQGCTFDNFKGDQWVSFLNSSATYALTDIEISGNIFNSFPGNTRGPTLITIPSACIVIGQEPVALTSITKVRIFGNTGNLQYTKGLCQIWSGVSDCVVSDNVANNVGTDAGISNDSACYAFLKYDIRASSGNGPNSSTVHYNNNTVNGVRDCGLYTADTGEIFIDGFYCSNQTSPVDTTLSKGGLALAGGTLSVVKNVVFENCYFGLNATGLAGSKLYIDSITTHNCNSGIKINPSAQVDTVSINGWRGNSTVASALGLQVQINTGTGVDFLYVNGMDVGATTLSVYCYIVGGVPTARRWEFGGRVRAGGVQFGAFTFPIILNPITYLCSDGPAGSAALNVSGCTKLTIHDQDFPELTNGGNCFVSPLAQGTIPGRFTFPFGATLSQCVYQSGGAQLGGTAPTWTGPRGGFVRNLNPAHSATAGTAYNLDGWLNQGGTTAWDEVRIPTQTNTATV